MQSLSPCTLQLHLDGRKQRTRSAVHSLDTASAARRISSTPIEIWSSSRSIVHRPSTTRSWLLTLPHRQLCPWTLIVVRGSEHYEQHLQVCWPLIDPGALPFGLANDINLPPRVPSRRTSLALALSYTYRLCIFSSTAGL